MMTTKYLEVTGRTESEAIENGLQQLGMDRDDVSVEILARPKTGFLGIGSTPAKVKLTYEVDEPVAPSPRELSPKVTEGASTPVAPPVTPVPPQGHSERSEESVTPVSAPPTPTDDPRAQAIVDFLTGLMAQMELDVTPHITSAQDGTYKVELVGEKLGSLIGRRGETLDAIQQLTSYSVNRGQSKRCRIHLDAENYRAKREESLVRLAEKVAAKVVKYRRSVSLEPMNAYERHIIHAALQDVPHVATHSTGVEPNRRTVVTYE